MLNQGFDSSPTTHSEWDAHLPWLVGRFLDRG
jgi:hypothetical protein